MSTPQKRLLYLYPPMTLLFGATFYLLHILLNKWGYRVNSLFFYIPIIAAAALVIYLVYFRHKIRAVNYKGVGPVTVATVYFMSMFSIPWTGLNLAALSTDHIQVVPSINDLTTATTPFVRITTFHAHPDQLIDEVIATEDKDDDGFMSYRFHYTGLVPVSETSQDTVANTWIEFMASVDVPHAMSVKEQLQFTDSLTRSNRNRVNTFPFDTITYFEILDASNFNALLAKHGLPAQDQHVVHAYTESLEGRRIYFAKLWFWIYAGLSIFFAGAVALGHYEQIDLED